ncbi:MAG: flagellar export chaperone FliS [Phycisphaerales bacterium]|nr:flagellar export chaperone FliS [Phycisphaerales bacterium]
MLNEQAPINAYLQSKVMSASPEELRLMLLDGSIRFAYQAKAGLENKDHEQIYLGFSQCRDIVLELLNTIKPEHAPEIAKRVSDLYNFMYGELVRCNSDRDLAGLEKIIKLLEYERETWAMLMEQQSKEKSSPTAQPNPYAAAPMSPQPLSIQA